jgi:CRISPR system Cascade subunit CasA
MMHNLLLDPIIRVRLHDGARRLNLPEVYAALAADVVGDFPALRAHQRHAWHALLCQLGALACLRAGLAAPPHEAEAWRAALRQLAPDHPDDAAFTLVTPPDQPGFLQAPIPGGSLAGFSQAATPDALDMLVTSRAHDVKPALMYQAAPEEWLFALLTIQTMEGYSGRDNYGIARMNGGSSNRPAVSLRPPGGVGAHVMRDITRLLALRDEVLEKNPHYAPEGLALVWLLPWDGAASLTPDRLDPYFVEICRRVRLVADQDRVRALTATSKAARIDFGPEATGLTGDPWTPIDARKGEAKALTIDARGFFYKRLADILGGKHRGFDLAPLHRIGAEEAEHTAFLLVCRALARGQGKTEGLHERRIPVPPRAVDFWRSGETAPLAEIAEERIEEAGKLRGALRRALMVLFQNGPNREGFQPTDPNSGKRAEPFLDRLEFRIDDDFFRCLFQEVQAEQDEARTRLRAEWLTELHRRARGILREAETGAPTSAVRRFRAQARAEAALSGMFFGMFKDYFPKETSDAA